MKIVILTLTTLVLLSGCAIKDVKPWQKGTLAKSTMKKGGGNNLFEKLSAHIYFSKEASKGGGGVAGGGCGCN